MAAVETSKKVLWLRELIEIFSIIHDSVQVHCDSQSMIHLAKVTDITSGQSILM